MRLVSTNSFKDNMFMFITQHTHMEVYLENDWLHSKDFFFSFV